MMSISTAWHLACWKA